MGRAFRDRYQQAVAVGRRAGNDIICDLSKEIPELGQGHDIVIHAAGKAHVVPKDESESGLFFLVNFEGTKNLVKGIEKTGKLPELFVLISTVAVYGLTEGEMITEEQPLNPVTPYAQSKVEAEQFLLNWGRKNGVKIGILRLPLVAGPRPPGNLGAMIEAISRGRYFRIGKARARKSMVWVEDIPTVLSALMTREGIYHLTDGYHPHLYEIEDWILRNSGRKHIPVLPAWLVKPLASAGSIISNRFPLTTDKVIKLTSTLTFDDEKARAELRWKSSVVTEQKIADEP